MAPAEQSRAIDESLFDWPSASPALKGSCCVACGRHEFPARPGCRYCGATDTAAVTLPRRGRLWTWTVQRFMPKSPYRTLERADTFRPFGVGYVELPGALRVEARLLVADPAALVIGAEMELDFYTQFVDDDGVAVVNYAFRPA